MMTAAKAAKRDEPHDADIEEPGIAPLHVHAQGHDRRDQPHVHDTEGHVPALCHAGETDEPEDEREKQDVLGGRIHTAFPWKMPVGRNRSTMMRIAKETANL